MNYLHCLASCCQSAHHCLCLAFHSNWSHPTLAHSLVCAVSNHKRRPFGWILMTKREELCFSAFCLKLACCKRLQTSWINASLLRFENGNIFQKLKSVVSDLRCCSMSVAGIWSLFLGWLRLRFFHIFHRSTAVNLGFKSRPVIPAPWAPYSSIIDNKSSSNSSSNFN